MEIIKDVFDNYNNIKLKIDNIINNNILSETELLSLSIDDINKLKDIYNKISDVNYNDKMTNIKIFQNKYIELENLSLHNKIEALIKWNTYSGLFNNNKILNNNKELVLQYINSAKIEDSINIYQNIYSLILSNNILFSKDDIININPEFIKYICNSKILVNKNSKYTKNNKNYDSDDNDSENNNTIKMANFEKIYVNILMVVEDEYIINECLKCIKIYSDPKLNIFPLNCIKFKGNILNDIINHYANTKISSIVEYRRTVGIVINNNTKNYYDYQKYISKNDIFSNYISIEFPYMSYVYVSKIEFDIGEEMYNEPDINISMGNEYILQKYKNYKLNDDINNKLEIKHTIVKDNLELNINPSSYIMIYISDYIKISDIRIYGEAISFI